MLDTQREELLAQTLLTLKDESQRLIRRHREIQEEFETIVRELAALRKNGRRQRARQIFPEFELPMSLMEKTEWDHQSGTATISSPEAAGRGTRKDRRSSHAGSSNDRSSNGRSSKGQPSNGG